MSGGTAAKATSAEAVQRLEIAWETKQLPKIEREGYGAATGPLKQIFDSEFAIGPRTPRPGVIWFSSLEPDEKAQKRMFGDETVAASARYFSCVKVYAEDIQDKSAREQYAKVLPTVMIFDSKGREVSRLAGQGISANEVYAAMQRAAAVEFRENLMTLVNRYLSFVRNLDKASNKVTELEAEVQQHQVHLAKHDCEPGRKALKETLDDLVPAKAEREKLLTQEKQLLTPARRDEPVKDGAKPVKVER